MPAPPLSNNFDGGVAGNTIATTDTGSGNQWNNVSIGASTTITYDNVFPRRINCMKVVQPATYANVYAQWTGFGSLTGNVWFRKYVYIPVQVSVTNLYIASMRNAAAGGCLFLQISSSGKLQMRNAADAFITGSASIGFFPINQWVRVEWRVLASTTVGEAEWWLYTDPDSESASEHFLATGQVLAANLDSCGFGNSSSPGPVSFTSYFSEIAVSTAGLIGPSKGFALKNPDLSAFPKSSMARMT